ncbi:MULTISPECIES: YbaB/EbfC family nucleoid-associated protein [Amycolatopsis]|uniref:YbaB/EbfC DNA-binding family protein n=1 Tax=Amycolatopsis tucumanensis TaxID=401106 RepID=A0ABP7I696_9PSEU|nr:MULTISPECIES: YbaB/EbfC family nucleoid-associated protein [Amycolatopsis]MCF6426217.1 YbaB/EbfC family nucleoid-associated protein [Amycolatopsis tucumanensis]
MNRELTTQSEAVEERQAARRRQAAQQVVTAQDDWGLVEVGVAGNGEVLEVAINSALFEHVKPSDLAEAMLQAARAAQRRARQLHR